jgi:hypothetical protein
MINTRAGDNALLCSGFFQENFRGSGYRASLESNFANCLVKNKIKLTTVGIHNYNWKPSYENFRDNMKKQGVNIISFYKSGMRWHAKVFILSKGKKPIFGIVGSSNITRNAFSITLPFNNECDVILWEGRSKAINSALNETLQNDEFIHEIIRAPYQKRLNFNLSISDRLQNIKDEIMNENLKPL